MVLEWDVQQSHFGVKFRCPHMSGLCSLSSDQKQFGKAHNIAAYTLWHWWLIISKAKKKQFRLWGLRLKCGFIKHWQYISTAELMPTHTYFNSPHFYSSIALLWMGKCCKYYILPSIHSPYPLLFTTGRNNKLLKMSRVKEWLTLRCKISVMFFCNLQVLSFF